MKETHQNQKCGMKEAIFRKNIAEVKAPSDKKPRKNNKNQKDILGRT